MINACPQTQCETNCVYREPPKAQTEGITKCSFVQGEAIMIDVADIAVSQLDASSLVANSLCNIQSLLPAHGHLPITLCKFYVCTANLRAAVM